jgi:hypothetical protein
MAEEELGVRISRFQVKVSQTPAGILKVTGTLMMDVAIGSAIPNRGNQYQRRKHMADPLGILQYGRSLYQREED